MGFRIQGPDPGPNDRLPKTGWPIAGQADAAHPEPQPALVQLVSDIGGRLMHWAKGGTAAPVPDTAQPSQPPAVPTGANSNSPEGMIEPSRCHRAAPAVRDETDSPEAMIKPSRGHRAAIEAHRDDWP